MPVRDKRKALVILLFLATCLFAARPAHAGLYTRFLIFNHPELEWRTIETEHFTIHYYPEVSNTANEVAAYCEIAYDLVCSQFDYYLTEKTNIVIRDTEEMANGAALYQEDWIVIWATNLYTPLRGRMPWIPTVITHEFAHIVSLKVNDNFFERSAYAVGLGLYRNGEENFNLGFILPMAGGFKAPFIWVEGGAEYWTDQAGVNHWSTSRNMLLRMSILEGALPGWDRMQTRIGLNRFDSERGYNTGYALGMYIHERFGPEKFAELAKESGKRWRLNWDTTIKDVLGIKAKDLYVEFLEWLRDRYQKEVQPIRTHPAIGEKLRLFEPSKPWDAMSKMEKEQDGILKIDGMFNYNPDYTSDGKTLVFYQRDSGGIVFLPLEEPQLPHNTGQPLSRKKAYQIEEDTLTAGDFHGIYSFSPDGSRLAVSGNSLESWYGNEWSLDGYYLNDLFLLNLERDASGHYTGYEAERLSQDLRAKYPAWSPDGDVLAFVQGQDGQTRLGLMDVKGDRSVKWLTELSTNQYGPPQWSPDGKQLLFYMYDGKQQDLYLMNRDGTYLNAITSDPAEERDPCWSKDGQAVYYTSDRSGIFNIHRMDMQTGEVVQLTNVLGGAYDPSITPAGNLLYSYFTAFGFKIHYLKKEEFYNRVVEEGRFLADNHPVTQWDSPLVQVGDQTFPSVPYNPLKNLMPVNIIPGMLYDNEHIRAGFDVIVMDNLEKHLFLSEIMLGEDYDITMQYVNECWYPDISVAVQEVVRSVDFGYRIALNESMPNDLTEVELKQRLKLRRIIGAMAYPLSDELSVGFDFVYRTIQGKTGLTGNEWDDQFTSQFYTLGLMYSSFEETLERGDNDINPRDGRQWTLSCSVVHTRMDEPMFGMDDGQILDTYTSTQFAASYSEYIAVPFWPLNRLHNRVNDWLESHNHTLEFSFQGGYIDRNVHFYDEFHAGGRIPLITIADFSSNVQFAGYEAFSISGETLLVASLAYRFPLWGRMGRINKRLGPIYIDKLFGSVFGTAGNAWSFNRSGEREIPFRDTASNGNKMLYDVGGEIRVKATMFNYFYWYSFIRVAYGLQKVYGTPLGAASPSDADGNQIYEDQFPLVEGVDEVEDQQIRVYLGLGTRW